MAEQSVVAEAIQVAATAPLQTNIRQEMFLSSITIPQTEVFTIDGVVGITEWNPMD